jgi:hypothetical protein
LKIFAAFLFASQTVFAFSVRGLQRPLPSTRLVSSSISLSPSSMTKGSSQQPAATVGKEVATSQARLDAIQTAINGVRTPSLQALAGALGLSSAQIGEKAFEDSTSGMETITGLAGGESEVAVKWQPSNSSQEAQSKPGSCLYLLSWDGNSWRASYLTPAADALMLQVLPVTGNTASLFAVVILRGMTAAPYPVVFRFSEHHASLVWDGRTESSLYASYDYGSIQFEKAGNGHVPVMVVAGRADPGLLIFPTAVEENGRGFQAATVYAWHNDAYVPLRSEYTHNPDYTLYRFIAALHLHDFKTAYSFIDPAQFLKTDKPSVALFKKRVQTVWPEFTDDRIFEVPGESEKASASHIFILRLGHKKMNVYHPTFTSGPAYRLTGLDRTKASE